MYKINFGAEHQISFSSEAEYYELLGYLAKGDGTTKLVWENNDEQGAWGKEGRILSYTRWPETLGAKVTLTAGTGRIISRINCNEFIAHISRYHYFSINENQDKSKIIKSIPLEYIEAFNRGFNI